MAMLLALAFREAWWGMARPDNSLDEMKAMSNAQQLQPDDLQVAEWPGHLWRRI